MFHVANYIRVDLKGYIYIYISVRNRTCGARAHGGECEVYQMTV